MTKWLTLSLCLLALLLLPVAGYAQCSNQVSISYFNRSGTLVSDRINNGQSGTTVPLCPSASGATAITLSSTSDALLQWIELSTVNGVTTERLLTSASRASGEPFQITVQLSSQTTYRVRSTALNCTGGTQNVIGDITLAPALALTANVSGICVGGSATLTAAGSSTGIYTWYQDGVLQPERGASIVRTNLLATTVFQVSTTTSACGASTQQLTIPVNSLSLSQPAPTVCSGSSATVTASYSGSGATFSWYNNATNALLQTTTNATSSTFTTPALTANTTFRVEAATNDCGTTLSQTFTVSVGALTASIAPSSPTVCTRSAVTLTASSNNPGATYQWQTVANNGTGTNISGATSATYTVFTANNAGTERYRVLVTAPGCGTSLPANVTITTVGSPTNTISPTANPTICAGASTTLTVTSNVSGASFVWYTTNAGQPLSTSASFSPSPTATTTYTVQISTGCEVSTLSRTVNVNQAVQVNPEVAVVNAGRTITLTASGGNSSTYTWTQTTSTGTITLPQTTATITVTPPEDGTIYRATGTTTNGCPNSDEARINISSTPLPVSLVSFEAVRQRASVLLRWATASEKDNAHFMVQRSTNGEAFANLGKVAGAGTTSRRTEYEFVDGKLPAATGSVLYYRLQQTDLDGSSTYSPVQAVQLSSSAASLQAEVFPNPYDTRVAVRLRSKQAGVVKFLVHDVVGRPLLSGSAPVTEGLQDVEVPQASMLPAGLYYLTVRQGNQQQVLKLQRR